MRTKETDFNKEKKKSSEGHPQLYTGIAIFCIFLNELEIHEGNTSSPPKKSEQLKSTDDKIIYSWSKPKKTRKNSR